MTDKVEMAQINQLEITEVVNAVYELFHQRQFKKPLALVALKYMAEALEIELKAAGVEVALIKTKVDGNVN